MVLVKGRIVGTGQIGKRDKYPSNVIDILWREFQKIFIGA